MPVDCATLVPPGRTPEPTPPPRRQRRSPAERLRIAIQALAQDQAEILSHHQQAWASITFSGARHTLVLEFQGAQAIAEGETLIAALPDHEFAIPGQIVADATIQAADHQLLPEPRLVVTVELLLLEDG